MATSDDQRAGPPAVPAFAVLVAGVVVEASAAAVQVVDRGVRIGRHASVRSRRLFDRVVTAALEPVLDRILPDVLARLDSGRDRGQLIDLVESIVDEVLPPVVDRALPEVLGRLSAEPEPMRELVWGQGAGMADEVAARVQDAARHADERVDRIARRLRVRR